MNLNSDVHSSQALKSLSAEIGCDYSKMEQDGEAGRLWDALNDLANDPIAYNSFIQKQLQHLESSKDGEVHLQPSASSAIAPFVPLHGFVVKTHNIFNSTRAKLFINICHHGTAVPKPINEDGNAVAESGQTLDNIQIPILISKLRDCFDGSHNKAMAVDVVVNTWCIDACNMAVSFKTDLVNLAIDSLKEEHPINVEAQGHTIPWKNIKSKYKGGLGTDGAGPRPFEDSQEPKKMKMEQVAESPSDLLKCQVEQKEQLQSDARGLSMPQLDKAKKRCGNLIQEIPSHPPSSVDPTAEDSGSSKSRTSKHCPVIKSGFLNNRSNKKPLYSNDGSNGDGSSGNGCSYAKFMSKCKVVDTAGNMSCDHKSKATFFGPEIQETRVDQDTKENVGPDITQTLKDLSYVMSGNLSGNEQEEGSKFAKEDSAPLDTGEKARGNGSITRGTTYSNNVTLSTNGKQITLELDLSSCYPKIDSMRDLDLQMSETSLMLVASQCNERWSATFPHHVDVGSVSAKFRRKQQMLEVSCFRK